MSAQTVRRLCIYCGRAVGRVKKGEHIIPEAVGGAETIESVCGSCNNEFSQLDRELCSRSPLSVVASQEIDSHVWQVWDVDHADGNLLLDARPDWATQSLMQYPQMVFEKSGPQLHGDHEEMLRFGRDSFEEEFVDSMLRAFRQHKAGEKGWLHFERVGENPALARSYRLPPRIISQRSIQDLAKRRATNKRALFMLRYQTNADRDFAFNALDTWNPSGGFKQLEIGIGSALPAMCCFYEPGKVLRGLAKIAVNLLAHHCPNSPINRHGLRDVIQVIRGEIPGRTAALLRANGFVHAQDIEPIKADDKAHSFRLLHMDGHWHVYSSFFGGRIGSFIRFPGPNQEKWCCADIIAPLRSRSADWDVRHRNILLPLMPLNVHIEWRDPIKIMPTVEMLNVETYWLRDSSNPPASRARLRRGRNS